MADQAEIENDLQAELSETQRVALETYRQQGSQALVKAAEIVYAVPDPKNHRTLSLAAWKMLHQMLSAAQADGYSSKQYAIPRSEVRRNHKGDERVAAALEELGTTPLRIEVTSPAGRRALMTVYILSSTIEEIEDRDDDLLYFAFTPEFAEIPRRSELWAKLSTQTIINFSSTYAFRLYEIGCQIAGRRDPVLKVTVERLRELLHIPPEIYPDFGQLKRRALDDPLKELNQLAPFEVLVPPNQFERKGRKVTGVTLVFKKKDAPEAAQAAHERERHSAGRKARRKGTVEQITQDDPKALWAAVCKAVDRPVLTDLTAVAVEEGRLMLQGSRFACDYAQNTGADDIEKALKATGCGVTKFIVRPT